VGTNLNESTVLVTGLPRSGTTLTCELLNKVPDTVALDEPMDWWQFTGTTPPATGPASRLVAPLRRALRRPPPPRQAPGAEVLCDNIERFGAEVRRSIEARGVALSRHVDGKVLGSKVADHTTESGLRAKLAQRGEIAIDRELSPHFLLAIKHNSGFTAILRPLTERFRVYAVVRNPLSILSSWQTVPFPPQAGHVAMGEAFDGELAATLAAIDDRIDRQFHLLEWFFSRFRDLLPPGSVVRYEDLVASGGAALAVISPEAASLRVPLENRNKGRVVYDRDGAVQLGRRLLDADGAWRHFYSQESIEEIVAV